MTKNKWILLIVAALVWAGTASAQAEPEPPEDEQLIELLTGYQGSETSGPLFKVAEYEVVDPGAMVGLIWRTSPYAKTQIGLDYAQVSSSQIRAGFGVDLDRVFRVEGTLDGFVHRLEHDDLSNLPAVSHIKTVRATDLAPSAEYGIRNRMYNFGTDFQHPAVPQVSFRAGYSELERKGVRQNLTSSHCTSCHVTSKPREVDNSVQDVTLGVHEREGLIDLDYEVLSRTFREKGATPVTFFELALRPAPRDGTRATHRPRALLRRSTIDCGSRDKTSRPTRSRRSNTSDTPSWVKST